MVMFQKLNLMRFASGSVFFIVMLVAVSAVFGQSTISGNVYDKQRNPLSAVDVELLNDLYQTIKRARTDSTGKYEFNGLNNGRFYVRVFAFQYDLEDQTQEVEINTQNIRGGQGSGFFLADFYLLPRKGGLADAELSVVFAQEVPAEAKRLYEQAMSEFSKNKPDNAISTLAEAVKIFPNYFLALQRLGRELYLRGQYQESLHFSFKAVEINPKSAASLFYLGSAFHKLGKDYFQASYTVLNKAIVLAPNSVQILWALGKAERSLGKLADAEKHLQQAKKLSKSPIPEIHKELAELYGNDLKKFKEAADELELYLKASNPNEAETKKVKAIISNLREKAKNQ
jgi:tetratricopeptide (TPR) repeat protein